MRWIRSAAAIAVITAVAVAGVSLADSSGGSNAPKAKASAGKRGPRGKTGKTGPRGPQGPEGPAGAAGLQGPAGAVSTVRMRTGAQFNVPRNSFAGGDVNCLAGERATGGGVYALSNVYFPAVVASYPLPNPTAGTPNNDITPTGWHVWVSNNDQTGTAPATATMVPYVICVA
jgi:hypothetical protein